MAVLDVYELAVTIPALTAFADAPIFDMRISGYGHAEAVAYIAALGTDGNWFYLTRHVPPDTALALVEAVAITLIILRVTRPGARFALPVPPAGRLAMLAAPTLMLLFDLGENALVAHMLLTAAPGPTLVAMASTLTQAKWVAISLAIALAIVLPASALLRGRRRQVTHPQQASPR
ncbi:hypothetical protein [Dichotomicrobium thermohalophilum]|uniref:hypothetical protein n=1 Tax=Dichotomicrobium thermohalophilum TaxID=933063 RepID=UPI0011C23BC2|nr:hypothetical protein [Dichotomicrobium thermohalophilum]